MDNTSEVAPPQVSVDFPQTFVVLDWGEAASIDPLYANQILVQLGNPGPDGIPDGIYISLGNVPPPVVATPDEATARAEAEKMRGTNFPVAVRGRFHINRPLVDTMVKLLQRAADQYDNMMRQVEAAKRAEEEG